MPIALDATYSLGENLSGVGVYSREICNRLAATFPETEWQWFFRSKRFPAALRDKRPSNVRRKPLFEHWGSRRSPLFHGLNQRLPLRPFPRQISTFHDLFVLTAEYSSAEFRTRFAAQARHAALASDLIIAVSQFTAGQVSTLLQVPASRIRVVHHGVVPRVLPAAPREKMVLCVGAIQKRKNQAALVRAFGAMPAQWQLVLAGSSGFGSTETIREIESSPCQSRIRLTGYVTDAELDGLYARASIFAFPSFDEGFGMPALEAMAAGVPVVAGNRSALPEICGSAALLVDPTDEQALAGTLRELANDEAQRERLAALGTNHVRQFSWERAVFQTAAVYRELVSF